MRGCEEFEEAGPDQDSAGLVEGSEPRLGSGMVWLCVCCRGMIRFAAVFLPLRTVIRAETGREELLVTNSKPESRQVQIPAHDWVQIDIVWEWQEECEEIRAALMDSGKSLAFASPCGSEQRRSMPVRMAQPQSPQERLEWWKRTAWAMMPLQLEWRRPGSSRLVFVHPLAAREHGEGRTCCERERRQKRKHVTRLVKRRMREAELVVTRHCCCWMEMCEQQWSLYHSVVGTWAWVVLQLRG